MLRVLVIGTKNLKLRVSICFIPDGLAFIIVFVMKVWVFEEYPSVAIGVPVSPLCFLAFLKIQLDKKILFSWKYTPSNH